MTTARTLTGVLALLATVAVMTGCPSVPKETVTLSNTVGRDLEEIHRAHRAMVELHYGQLIAEANRFIDETYRPAFISEFAREFQLSNKVELIVDKDPDKLLPVLTRFVKVATQRVEAKRTELVGPINKQRRQVLTELERSYRRIQSAQALVTANLASVRKVRNAQNEALDQLGLEGLPEDITGTTARVSDTVADVVRKGEDIEAGVNSASTKLKSLDAAIEKAKRTISQSTQ